MIRPPIKPEPPSPIDVEGQPDELCVWGKPYDDGDCWHGIHAYAECVNCGWESPECHFEVRISEQVSMDCLRNQASDLAQRQENEYRQAMRDYDAQMRYYREITQM